jgi:hypothetical protein
LKWVAIVRLRHRLGGAADRNSLTEVRRRKKESEGGGNREDGDGSSQTTSRDKWPAKAVDTFA